MGAHRTPEGESFDPEFIAVSADHRLPGIPADLKDEVELALRARLEGRDRSPAIDPQDLRRTSQRLP